MQVRTITDDQVDQLKWQEFRRQQTTIPTKSLLFKHATPKEKSSKEVDYHHVMHLLKEKEGGGKKKKPEDQEPDPVEHNEEASDNLTLEGVIELDINNAMDDQGPNVGDRVCLQGVTDGHVARPWQIVRIGDAFFTLRALDTTDLPVKDQIRVVSKADIVPELQVLQQQQQQQQQLFQQPPPFQQPQQGLVLNIAPKFVNGPDQSQEVVAPPLQQQQQPMPIQQFQEATPPPPAPKDEPVDFSKGLIIVKKQ